MTRRNIVIQSEHLSEAAASWLRERCELVACAHTDPLFYSSLENATGLVVRTYTIVDDALLHRAAHLKVVGRAGVGLDNINVPACRRRGVEVVYTPDANTQAVVEYVMCLLCDALRPRVALARALDSKAWNHLRETTVGTRQMNELTIGLLGFGRVGQRVAAVAKAIGFHVLYNDLTEIEARHRNGAEPVSLHALFEQSDVLSIHIDGRASNRSFVNAHLIDRMRTDVLLINTSRGFVVDNLSLAKWMKQNPQAQAMLDVHDPEPFDETYPLLGLPNVTLYPHLASRTEAAMLNMSWVVKDVVAVLEGEKPKFVAPSE